MTLAPAPYHNDLVGVPMDGAAYWIKAADGVRLRVAVWTPKDKAARGTVYLFPGRTEFIEKYGFFVQDLLDRGFAVICNDWRGQGLSDRLLDDPRLGHVGAMSDYQLDIDAILAAADELNLPQPRYLIGHSMGGGIGLRALMNGLDVKACVFTGPMFGIYVSPAMKPVAALVGKIAPLLGKANSLAPSTTIDNYVQVQDFEGNTLTKDPDMYAMMQSHLAAQPELGLGGPTIRWLTLAMAECADMAKLPSPETPCITYLGTDEQIVDSAAIKDRMSRWPNGSLELVDKSEHEVLMEVPETRAKVLDQIDAFFAKHAD